MRTDKETGSRKGNFREEAYSELIKEFCGKWGINGDDPLLDIYKLLVELHYKVDGVIEPKIDEERLRRNIVERIGEVVGEKITVLPVDIDYDLLARKVAESLKGEGGVSAESSLAESQVLDVEAVEEKPKGEEGGRRWLSFLRKEREKEG